MSPIFPPAPDKYQVDSPYTPALDLLQQAHASLLAVDSRLAQEVADLGARVIAQHRLSVDAR